MRSCDRGVRADREDARLAGTVLADRYALAGLIGVGGMGSVYRAYDRELDDMVALKVLRVELAADPEMIEAFRSEVRLARKVTHRSIARTFELGRAGPLVFCTIELIAGEPLSALLARTGGVPRDEAIAIARTLCDAIDSAHRVGVIHRDIKPDNIIISDRRGAVLVDFGVAALSATVGEVSGTPAYMAPEQARGEPPTPACDIYAIGIVLYELLTGRRAFSDDPQIAFGDKQRMERIEPPPGDVPDELRRVIGRATARDPGARFTGAAELRNALEPWAQVPRRTTTPMVAMPDPREAPMRVAVIAPRGSAGDARMYLAEAI